MRKYRRWEENETWEDVFNYTEGGLEYVMMKKKFVDTVFMLK